MTKPRWTKSDLEKRLQDVTDIFNNVILEFDDVFSSKRASCRPMMDYEKRGRFGTPAKVNTTVEDEKGNWYAITVRAYSEDFYQLLFYTNNPIYTAVYSRVFSEIENLAQFMVEVFVKEDYESAKKIPVRIEL
jgi:hypothetical protein